MTIPSFVFGLGRAFKAVMAGACLCAVTATACAAGEASGPAHVAASPEGFPKAILRGEYADPTILRDGADYYMTHSPFGYAPAFLIWHSRDLLHWQPIARAMANSAHAYAPELVKVNGKYHLYYPSNKTNYVITADNIRGPWSAPVDLKVPKIDPGHAVGEDGRHYLFLSGGQRVELAADGLSATTAPQTVYQGWKYPTSWVTECMCLESPKILRKGGYFYMVSAQGGTAGPATSHMAVVARAKSIHGPWENSPLNPLVHTYGGDEPWWSKGHGTLVDDVNGNWWIVYHAYQKGAYTLGRMTLIDPIEWTAEGWPVLARKPQAFPGANGEPAGDGMALSDDFEGPVLGIQWTSLGSAQDVKVGGGRLAVPGRGAAPGDAKHVMTIPTDTRYEVEAELWVKEGTTGGLVLFYNSQAFAGVTTDGSQLTVHRSATDSTVLRNPAGRHLRLKIVNRDERATFLVSLDGVRWEEVATNVDVSPLNHNNRRGFLSLKVSLMAAGSGVVEFDNFKYRQLP